MHVRLLMDLIFHHRLPLLRHHLPRALKMIHTIRIRFRITTSQNWSGTRLLLLLLNDVISIGHSCILPFWWDRDDPYCTNITDKGIEVVFNVYDIITEYNGSALDSSVDCTAAYYISGLLICQATNSTETTEFSSDGKTITSTCLHLVYMWLLQDILLLFDGVWCLWLWF